MAKEKFNYQFVFDVGDDDKVIFVGTTSSALVSKLSQVQEWLLKIFKKDTVKVINIAYQPIVNHETQKSKEEECAKDNQD